MASTPLETRGVRVVLETADTDTRGVPWGALTAYAVDVDAGADALLRIGYVAKIETSSYRKAGRLITRTFRPIRWKAAMTLAYRSHRSGEWIDGYKAATRENEVGYQHDTRGAAVEAVVRAWQEWNEESE